MEKLSRVKLIRISRKMSGLYGEFVELEFVSKEYEEFFENLEEKAKEQKKEYERIYSPISNSYTGKYNYDKRIKLYVIGKINGKVGDYIVDDRYKDYDDDEIEFKFKNYFVDIEINEFKLGPYSYQSNLAQIYCEGVTITVCEDQHSDENLAPDKKYDFLTINDYKLLKSICNKFPKNIDNENYIEGFLHSFNETIKDLADSDKEVSEFSVGFNLDKLTPGQIEHLHKVTNELFKGQYLHIKDERKKVHYFHASGPPTIYNSYFKMLNV